MTVTIRDRLILPTLALGWLAAPSSAQSVLHTFDGESADDFLGLSVSGAGDVNQDGFADLICGAHGVGTAGAAFVFSGVDGSILYTFVGDSTNDFFGYSVSGAEDVNGDGFPDFIVGAIGADINGNDSGRARVFSGLDGSILYTFDGDSKFDNFGWSVSGAGDVNGDGFADLIVGAPFDGQQDGGGAWVFSGADGSVLHVFHGGPEDWFGYSVSGAGDVDGDGFDDLIAGAPLRNHLGQDDRGRVRVFSGKNGTVLYTFHGDMPFDWLGYSVSGAGDVNGDGFGDVIAGAPGDNHARVFSGIDGSILYLFDGDLSAGCFGCSVSGAGDVNGDGFDDLIVGDGSDDTNGVNSGIARVFSGMDGSVLYTLEGDASGDRFGSVSAAGDVNGDGFDDLIVGALFDDNQGNDSGSARVVSGCDTCPIGTNYCGPANFNSTGQSAVIIAVGSTKASVNLVTLTASQLPQNVFGYFLNSDVQGFTPFPPGSKGNLCLGGGIGRHAKQIGNTGAAGELVIDVDLTALPRPGGTHSVMAGETWNFQCWFRDNVGGPTSNFTDGIEIVFK